MRDVAGEAAKSSAKIDEAIRECETGNDFSDLCLRDPIPWATLAGRKPPSRRWVVDGWIGRGHVTSLYGRAGIGKSLLAQQIATQVPRGESVFGLATERARVGPFCEDDDDELWRREARIVDALGTSLADIGDFVATAEWVRRTS